MDLIYLFFLHQCRKKGKLIFRMNKCVKLMQHGLQLVNLENLYFYLSLTLIDCRTQCHYEETFPDIDWFGTGFLY